MKKIKVVLERGVYQFGAYAENIEGIYGAENTVAEDKQSIIDAIRLTKELNKSEAIPQVLNGEYEIVYRFDTESLLNYYGKIFTKAALERLTGINQKQIQHYSSGLKKPRAAQVKKIETALHKLRTELQTLELSY